MSFNKILFGHTKCVIDPLGLCGKAVKCFTSSGIKGFGTKADVSGTAVEAEKGSLAFQL